MEPMQWAERKMEGTMFGGKFLDYLYVPGRVKLHEYHNEVRDEHYAISRFIFGEMWWLRKSVGC